MAPTPCSPSCLPLRGETEQHERAEQLCFEGDEGLRRLARSVHEAASRLATAEAALAVASGDVDARDALVSEIDSLDEEIRKMRWARRDVTGEEACRAASVEKLGALRSIETDARLEEREALALSARELLRARAKRAVADLDAATTQLLLKRRSIRRAPRDLFEGGGSSRRDFSPGREFAANISKDDSR